MYDSDLNDDLIVRRILEHVNSEVDSLIFIGKNSEGKTRLLNNLAKEYYKNNEQVIYIPEHIKNLVTSLVAEQDSAVSPFEETPHNLPNIKINLEEYLETRNDTLADELLYILRKSKDEIIYEFFKNNLGFELIFKPDGEVWIKRKEKKIEEILTSAGFKLMIRISYEIYSYLQTFDPKEKTYILVDEIDDKLYWDKRIIFFKELFIFLKEKFNNIIFIFSTNMPDILYSLPKDYKIKIIKLLQDENLILNFESYDANDFLTPYSIDKIIFNKSATPFIEKSSSFQKLEKIYKYFLQYDNSFPSTTFEDYKTEFNNINRNTLTIKEKIIYDAIKELI